MNETRFAELIARIAHDLRSPLTSIKGFSTTLVSRWEKFEDHQRFELVEAIAADADRMSRIVSEVLDLARLESNRLELHRRHSNLADLVDGALRDFGVPPGSDRFELSIPGDLSLVVDPDRFRNVLFNVFESAVRFSGDRPIDVSANLEADDVVIDVGDRGMTIPPDRLEGLLEEPSAGSGPAMRRAASLGLYLSRRLVEAHGGTITVISEKDEGTKFEITIPKGP